MLKPKPKANAAVTHCETNLLDSKFSWILCLFARNIHESCYDKIF